LLILRQEKLDRLSIKAEINMGALFLAMRRKNIQEMISMSTTFDKRIMLNDNLAIEFIDIEGKL
jgi:hypothetical protein